MSVRFSRPQSPYNNVDRPNDNQFKNLTRNDGRPIPDVMFEDNVNYLIDSVNNLDDDIQNIEAGVLQGSDDPANIGKLVTTNGNIPNWTYVSDNNILPAGITGASLAEQTITTRELGPASVNSGNIASNSITSIKITNSSIIEEKIADNAVTTPKIANNSVITDKIPDAAITTDKIANNAITTVKILDANVTTAKILDANITTSKIADGAITLPKIAGGVLTPASVKADQIAANSSTVYTNPAVQQFHPSAAKFWCSFDGTSPIGTNPVATGYNVSSVEHPSTGVYIINYNVPFTSSNYCVISLPSYVPRVGPADAAIVTIQSITPSSVQIRVQNTNSSAEDVFYLAIMGFGLQ